MNLYRDPDGFIILHPYNPGAGYTFLGDAPAGPVSAVAEWWRDVDKGALTSDWHPSIQGGMEIPKPPGIAGSGVNIFPPRYSNFEEVDGLPPFFTSGCTVDRVEGGYNGTYRLIITATANNGECWFTNGPDSYNIKLTPNLRWIISGFFINDGLGQGFTARLLTSEGDIYDMPASSAPTGGAWKRKSATLDLRQDGSIGAMFGIIIPNAGGSIEVDALMLEEWIGTDPTPSAYFSPPSIVDGGQVIAGTVAYSRAAQSMDFMPLSASESPVILWGPVAPAARFRGAIAVSVNIEIERPTNDSDLTVVITFIREGVTIKTARHTLVTGQTWAIIQAEWVDQSYALEAIHYQIGVNCAEDINWRGVGKIVELKK